MKEIQLRRDEHAAATELGYVFTFLLGVLLLTMFSVWAWDIETATRSRWNENAIEANMDDIAAAIERADEASRIDGASYAESVEWRSSEADESRFKLVLTDFEITLVDEGGTLDTSVIISGTGNGSHEGQIYLGGASKIWVVHDNGFTTIQLDRPQSL
ncbi:MAG: hypothetical protein NZ736_04960 [Candidatus Poseidoniaceae archaeon]|nr:hypothetical protein [Candidatus Poseidoniaceae archaeon]